MLLKALFFLKVDFLMLLNLIFGYAHNQDILPPDVYQRGGGSNLGGIFPARTFFNLTTVFWGLFRPRRALIVPNFVIGWMLLLLNLIILCITDGI